MAIFWAGKNLKHWSQTKPISTLFLEFGHWPENLKLNGRLKAYIFVTRHILSAQQIGFVLVDTNKNACDKVLHLEPKFSPHPITNTCRNKQKNSPNFRAIS